VRSHQREGDDPGRSHGEDCGRHDLIDVASGLEPSQPDATLPRQQDADQDHDDIDRESGCGGGESTPAPRPAHMGHAEIVDDHGAVLSSGRETLLFL
jgi:hypothetical protein